MLRGLSSSNGILEQECLWRTKVPPLGMRELIYKNVKNPSAVGKVIYMSGSLLISSRCILRLMAGCERCPLLTICLPEPRTGNVVICLRKMYLGKRLR